LRDRGLEGDPRLAVGDGALGFWKALPQVFPTTRWQRCWLHKAVNVLNHFPRSRQPAANAGLQDVWMAPTRADAVAALERFAWAHRAKYPKAVERSSSFRRTVRTLDVGGGGRVGGAVLVGQAIEEPH
jgi:transposase-like protein